MYKGNYMTDHDEQHPHLDGASDKPWWYITLVIFFTVFLFILSHPEVLWIFE